MLHSARFGIQTGPRYVAWREPLELWQQADAWVLIWNVVSAARAG